MVVEVEVMAEEVGVLLREEQEVVLVVQVL